MPDNSVGVYTLPPSYKVTNGDATDENQHNPPFEDLAQSMSNRLHRDGRTSWTGNQNANGNKITGLASGSSDGDALTVGQARGSSEKTDPADDDRFLIADSAASWAFKRLTWANIRAKLASTFLSLTGGTMASSAVLQFAAEIGEKIRLYSTTYGIGVASSEFTLWSSGVFRFRSGSSSGAVVGELGSSGFTLPADPTQNLHAATKQYVDARQSVGVGQTWQNLTSSRSADTAYQNTTGKPIFVSVHLSNANNRNFQVSQNGSSWMDVGYGSSTSAYTVSVIIPAGWYYRVAIAFFEWKELR